MKGPILVVILCFAYSHGMLAGLEEEAKEEHLFKIGNIPYYVEQTGKGQMLVVPGMAPTIGGEDSGKVLAWLKTKGFNRYNSTVIKEVDLGDHYMQIASYTVYDKDDSVSDEGTYLKFYNKASGNLRMVLNGADSSLTPWPVTKAEL